MRVLDCFTFFDEIDVLKMRLELHYDHVDRFYICEADRTFRGRPKPYNFQDSQHAFRRWQNKICYIKHSPKVKENDLEHKDTTFNLISQSWQIEHSQRNALSFCLSEANDEDVAIISDVDEFVDPAFFQMIKESIHARSFDIARLNMRNHYYFMNCAAIGENRQWQLPIAIKAKRWRDEDNISHMRSLGDIGLKFENCGWHFSYLGGVEAVQKKISSFSHSELDKPNINNKENILKSIASGIDYIGRDGHEFAFYPISHYPESIQSLMKENPRFVKWVLF